MNIQTIQTLAQSLFSSPLSSSPVAGVLSGAVAGTISDLFFLNCSRRIITDKSLAGNALMGAIPPLLFGNYLGALISVPVGISTLISGAGLKIHKKDGGYQHLTNPILFATACVAALGKFALDLSLTNSAALGGLFIAAVDIVLSIYIALFAGKLNIRRMN